jgi:hypothetical protein
MPVPRFGNTANVRNVTPSSTFNTGGNIGGMSPQSQFSIISGRVKNIILSNEGDGFLDHQQWNSIGMIYFENVTQPSTNAATSNAQALPLFSNNKQYPLVGEIVPIIQLADNTITSDETSVAYYYLPPINLWNNNNNNWLPSPKVTLNGNKRSYLEVEAGAPVNNISPNQFQNIESDNPDFPTKNVSPLAPYSGDIIFEGRWGNSIRFTSTATSSLNPWSVETINAGDPIILIRNGQSTPNLAPSPSFIPVNENINNDNSSIYLTSTQVINLDLASTSQNSFKNTFPPITGRAFNKPQLIFNSDRITLNSKTDSIILSAANPIHLTSQKSVNIEATKEVVINSPKLYLGQTSGAEADIINYNNPIQSAVKGEELTQLLSDIIFILNGIQTGLEGAVYITPAGTPAPINSLVQSAGLISTKIDSINSALGNNRILSKNVKLS